ncbi:MAG TPA: DUF3830 family protein [Steroidobacteraceae bacterium]|jgi:hypothetical protein
MPNVRLHFSIGAFRLSGRIEPGAPASSAWLLKQLPYVGVLLQARWSGEAGWSPLRTEVRLEPENAMTHPKPGQILLYAGACSEPELLIPYGICGFACKVGPLSGNHIATLDCGVNELQEVGGSLQFKGAQSLRIALTPDDLDAPPTRRFAGV